jgi:hypothetical protein
MRINLGKLAKTIMLSAALTGCVSGDGTIRMPAILTPMLSADAGAPGHHPTPAVCSEIDIVHYSTGKPDVTVADVQAALTLPPQANPLGHARNLLGDTTPTMAQIQDNNAVLDRLCPAPAAPPPIH